MHILLLQRGKFARYTRIPPVSLLHLSPVGYMTLVGATELVCVGLLLFGRSRPGVLSTWVLLAIIVGALYTHVSIGDTVQDMGGALAGLVFLMTRLYTMGALRNVEIKVKI